MTEEQRRRAKQLFDDPDCLNEHTVKDLVAAVNRLIGIQERVALLLANLEQRVAALEENVEIEKTKREPEKETCDKTILEFVDHLKEYIKGRKYTKAENGTTIDEMLISEDMEKRYAWYLSHNQCCDSIINTIDELANSFKHTNEKLEEDEVVWVNDCPVCQFFNIPRFNVCPKCKTKITRRMIHKKIGRWSLDKFGYYKCSVCEGHCSIPYGTCPRCNTEMKTYGV